MALEMERKYLDVDHAALRARLKALGAEFLGRWFEANAVYDDSDRSLKAAGTLLRLREKQGRHVLTLKRRPDSASPEGVKVYEEHETEVADGGALRALLAGLGYAPAFAYEKVREKWRLEGCEICLDALPFGDFLEIEGDEAGIEACARALKLPPDKASAATYHELNRRRRESAGLPPEESFVFPAARAGRLRAELSAQPLDSAPEGA